MVEEKVVENKRKLCYKKKIRVQAESWTGIIFSNHLVKFESDKTWIKQVFERFFSVWKLGTSKPDIFTDGSTPWFKNNIVTSEIQEKTQNQNWRNCRKIPSISL